MLYRRLRQAGASYFFTLVTFARVPVFADASEIARYRSAVEKIRAKRPLVLEAEVILPDHIHALWTLPENDADYPTRLRLIKAEFSRGRALRSPTTNVSASRQRKQERDIWQRRYWEHLIRDERDFQAHLDYIHFNPVKHGLSLAPRDWPHSTFHDWVARGVYDEGWGSRDPPLIPEWVAARE